ncbi:MAG: glycosyltransferase family 4 protein [Bacteroidota bacterium]
MTQLPDSVGGKKASSGAMNILVINWQDITNPLGGGAEVHLHQIFSRIAAKGHKVTLLCSWFPGAPPEETIDGIQIVRRGSRDLFNFQVPSAYRQLRKRQQFDVVVDDLNKIPFFTPLFVKEPLVGIAHHLFDTSIFRETNALVASYVYAAERLGLAVYRQSGMPFMVVSPSTQQEFMKHGFTLDRLPLAFNCVDHGRYKQTGVPKSQTPLVGYFGRLKKYKSVDHLLQALPLVLKHVPELRLVVMGEGDDKPRLEGIARELGIADRVEFTGFVSEEKKVEMLQRMWVKVTTSSKEGWGLTVLEANACGTPVLASNVPGLRDSIKDSETGLLYEYGNVAELAAKLTTMLIDSALRSRLATNALSWAKKFDWDVVAGEVIEVLKKHSTRVSSLR